MRAIKLAVVGAAALSIGWLAGVLMVIAWSVGDRERARRVREVIDGGRW